MELLVLPVSGGGFATQLTIIEYLCDIGYKPLITLGSSGGNVAAYIASAAHWTRASVRRVAANTRSDLFAMPWNPIPSLSLLVGFFQGNVNQHGRGIIDLISTYFTTESLGKYEIWTGTYNKNRQRTRLFCNLREDQTILDLSKLDLELTQCMSPVFTGLNMPLISTVSIASASIPAIVPPCIIDNEAYIDGGISAASPLTIMQECILDYAKRKATGLHIIYVNSVNLSTPNIQKCYNLVDNWKEATHNLVRSQTIADRFVAYQLIKSYSNSQNIQYQEYDCNDNTLITIKTLRCKASATLLEFYPTIAEEVNIINFEGADVIATMNHMRNHIRCRLWYIL